MISRGFAPPVFIRLTRNTFVMEINLINLHASRLKLFQEVQQEFNRQYPFLKVESLHLQDNSWINGLPKAVTAIKVSDLLREDIGLSDEMTVNELGSALKEWFGNPVRVFRKGGNVWIDTGLTGDWSLQKQNDHGRDIATGYQ